jgi:tryptophan synthase alpha chain
MGVLETHLREMRDGGRKGLVPYVTGGAPGVDASLLRELETAGADAIEVGIPHSDPIMDGGVIQEASRVALEAGTRPGDVLGRIREAGVGIPVAVMTYVNPVLRIGYEAFAASLEDAGVTGAIVPDLPVDETDELAAAAGSHGVDVVLLAAPGTDPGRIATIGRRAHGFVYCVATYGVTGAREALAGTAREVVDALRPATDLPLLVGVGIATPDQAREACTFADGVIVGSALMAPILAGDRAGALEHVASMRAALG